MHVSILLVDCQTLLEDSKPENAHAELRSAACNRCVQPWVT